MKASLVPRPSPSFLKERFLMYRDRKISERDGELDECLRMRPSESQCPMAIVVRETNSCSQRLNFCFVMLSCQLDIQAYTAQNCSALFQ